MRMFFTFFVMLITVAACNTITDQNGKPLPMLTFEQYKPLPLKVGSINVERTDNPESVPYNRASSFPVSPANALERYLQKRYTITAEPAGGIMHFVIEDASLPFKIVEQENSVLSALSLGEKEEYTLNYAVKLQQESITGQTLVKTVLRYQKSKQFPKSFSLAELEEAYLAFVEEAIQKLDEAIVNSLNKNFKIISSGPAYTNETFFEELNSQESYQEKTNEKPADEVVTDKPIQINTPVVKTQSGANYTPPQD